jgi:nucleotide-binding universal stress UspA family protein
MLNVIVPLDFSQTSFNAAHFAAQMYKDKPARLILYHFYTDGEDTTMARNYLNSQKEELGRVVSNIEIELESGHNFIDSLAAFAHGRGAFMIVMGLTGKTPREQRFSGSNTLKLSEKEICPVLIVPEDATYNGISNALITSELKSVEDTPTLLCIKKVLQFFKPSLHILNINSNHYISVTKDFKEERDKMEGLLAEFNPEFYFMRLFDFHESVEVFTRDKNIDLIIIAPRYHNFFERLFKTQHTKKLIYQSKVPVLAVHE